VTRWGRFEWAVVGGMVAVEAAWLLLLYAAAEAVVSWAVAP